MTTLTAVNYVEDLSTEKREDLATFKRYLQEAIGYILSRHFRTDEDVELSFRYNDSSQAPFVEEKDINCVQEALSSVQVSERNLQAITFLDEWFAEPDDLGDAFWDDFEKELEANRFSIP